MIKQWEITAEINMDASRYKTVIVKANTERKARQFAIEKLKKDGAFFVANISIKQIAQKGNFMKKVTGYISVRALGCYDFEFYVDDNATEDEIKQKVDDVAEMSMDYHVEEGYIAEQQTVYRKKQPWEDRK